MPTVELDLPEDVFSALRQSPEGFAREMRVAAAIFWYQQRRISQEKAAKVAGVDRRTFLDLLYRAQIDVYAVDFESLQREIDRS